MGTFDVKEGISMPMSIERMRRAVPGRLPAIVSACIDGALVPGLKARVESQKRKGDGNGRATLAPAPRDELVPYRSCLFNSRATSPISEATFRIIEYNTAAS